MARVTVEDCAEVVQNRFELVALASQRSKAIASGSPITVERDNDKNAVVALREIANKSVSTEDLRVNLVRTHQERADIDQQLQEQFEKEDSTEGSKAQVAEEMEDLQRDASASDADALLYGGDDVQAED